MRSQVNDMLLALPPLQGNRHVVIPGQQSVKDIIKEVCAAHKEFAQDYDCLSDMFIGKNLLRSLFEFCQDNLPYIMESENLQTTRSPTAILLLADNWGCDCKHYAGFIGGVIDACNRAGYTHYDWCYRFASYDPFDSTKEHVYIVVDNNGREIWIDPAPIENEDGSFTVRSFNDRKVLPFYQSDFTPKNSHMSLQRIRGIYSGYAMMGYIQDDSNFYDYGGITRLTRNLDDSGGGGLVSNYGLQEPVVQSTESTAFYDPWYVEAPMPAPQPVQDVWQPTYDPILDPLPADTADQYPDAPAFNPADYNKIETLTRPVITDYPTVTGDPIFTLPDRETLQVIREPVDTSIKVGFNIMDFVKANPWETALIGGAVVLGGYYLFFYKKKNKRA